MSLTSACYPPTRSRPTEREPVLAKIIKILDWHNEMGKSRYFLESLTARPHSAGLLFHRTPPVMARPETSGPWENRAYRQERKCTHHPVTLLTGIAPQSGIAPFRRSSIRCRPAAFRFSQAGGAVRDGRPADHLGARIILMFRPSNLGLCSTCTSSSSSVAMRLSSSYPKSVWAISRPRKIIETLILFR